MKSFKLLLFLLLSLSCLHALPEAWILHTWSDRFLASFVCLHQLWPNYPLPQASKAILQVFCYQKNDKSFQLICLKLQKVSRPYSYSLEQNLLQAVVLSQLTKPLFRHVVQVSLQITTCTLSTWKCT